MSLKLFLVLVAGWCISDSVYAAPPAPDAPGPYPVGVTTLLLEDHSRPHPETGKPRPLLTEIWYPAAEETRNLPKNTLADFNLRGQHEQLNAALKLAFKVDIATFGDRFQNIAVRDARIADGLFPLILFSHGNGGMRHQSTFLTDHLASHGYVVVSADHTENAAFTVVDGTLIPMNPRAREQAAEDRPKDIKFLIDVMERFHRGADSRFMGRIDLENIGVTGHSFGGYTAVAAADLDPRVKAIAPMAAVGRNRERFDVPVLAIVATEDDTIKEEGNARIRAFYEASKGPRFLVEFKNAGHYSFTDMPQYDPAFGDGVGTGVRITNGEQLTYLDIPTAYRLTNGYTTAFFGRFLKQQTDYLGYLTQNHLPEEVVLKHD